MATQEQKPETKPSALQEEIDAISRAREAIDWGLMKMEERVVIERSPIEARHLTARSEEEVEAWTLSAQDQALLDSFDSRLAEAHRGMDRILARLNVE